MVSDVFLKIRVKCDSCPKKEEVEAWVAWWDLQVTMGDHDGRRLLNEDQLPDLWEYYTSGGWGATDYTKTQLLCPDCVRKWREETILDQMARKASEKPEKPTRKGKKK